MQHFKFVNWGIGKLVVSFFDVTNRLKARTLRQRQQARVDVHRTYATDIRTYLLAYKMENLQV